MNEKNKIVADSGNTITFSRVGEKETPHEVLMKVYYSMREKGYDPVSQIVGYLISGDPTYITSYNNARYRICSLQRDELVELMKNSKEVLQCYHVTGAYTFLIKVSCGSMPQLEHLILQFQKLGTTSTQIILSTPVNHGELDALML